jgi:uncharacterized protein HemY
VNDHQDEGVRDSVSEFAGAEEAIIESEALNEEADDLAPVDDATINTPLATLEIQVAPNGERQYSGRERWLRDLNHAIADHPEAPANYVLRGELALETRDYSQAAADFEKALELASAQVETENWGILAQAMQDRAYRGLTQARRHLQRKHKRHG